ncbi:hypothetical protein Xen7305DRAFT_00051010 [Xenococcus sp. PCC 7305]|uniref:hypothetical protein n=1 Tax=Xenococcus sp. PCC 7305 TaxID=102125 RepID=UPI0002ABFFA9|nr:hypothetical protein [Xenococcus sp. PCC 7305]ELS05358.1 hypothetical protein Xen7305DRAFT_00051010 [Xenococcus sp. PCC 7305]
MTISKEEAKQLLERIIFEQIEPSDWVQDIWDFNPIHGDSAARMLEIFQSLIECSSQEQLENFLQALYKDQLEQNFLN